jgi:hypothetical protein
MNTGRLVRRFLAFLGRHWPALGLGLVLLALMGSAHGFSLASDLVTVPLCLTGGALIERTFAAAEWACPDRKSLIAHLPLGTWLVGGLVAQVYAKHAVRSGSLDNFYDAAAPLLGLLLISITLEARQLASHDPWLRAFRSWWTFLIILGILFALMGLTPGIAWKTEETQFATVWAAVATAITALWIVTTKDPPTRDEASNRVPDVASSGAATTRSPSQISPAGEASLPTRTPAPSTPA